MSANSTRITVAAALVAVGGFIAWNAMHSAPQRTGSAQPSTPGKSASAGTAKPTPAKVTPTSAVVAKPPQPPPAPLKAVRDIPRKKLPLVSLDLDGDGVKEEMVVKQRQPVEGWKGKDRKKGPRYTLEIRAASVDGQPGKVLGSVERYGWSQGWAQIGVRIGGGAQIGMFYWSVPEAHEPRASYVFLREGKVTWGEFKRLPLQLIDLHFGQMESVLTLSQELFHDFMKRGTTGLIHWEGDSFQPKLDELAFEICVVKVQEPGVFLAVVSKDQRELKVITSLGPPGMPLQSAGEFKVTPASEGPKFSVPTGFALSCNRERGTVQYKSQHFALKQGRLVKAQPKL